MSEKLTDNGETSPRRRPITPKTPDSLATETSNIDTANSSRRTSVDHGRPDKPIHRLTESMLSASSGFNNYRGFLNLCVVLLVLSNFRVALENVIKYGILIDPFYWVNTIIHEPQSPNTILVFVSNIFILFALWVEKQLAHGKVTEAYGHHLHVANLAVVLVLPAVVVLWLRPFPMFSMFTMGLYSVLFLKLISYQAVNRWCRTWRQKNPDVVINSKSSEKVWPENLTITDMYYFVAAPTLCYEINFPRTDRIRIRFLLKRIVEMIVLSQVMLALIQQWIFPTVRNSLQPFQQMDVSRVVERICKLAIPNHIIWLIFFYWLFHSVLNFTGELLKFGDREFYRDWWNSESVEYFWQNWNICVHRWCVRHLYKPLRIRHYSKLQASLVVFLVSAFFHEYLVSVPLCMFRMWSFMAMLFQVPFAFIVSRYLRGPAANMAVWISLIIGQPIAIMMYWHDAYLQSLAENRDLNNTSGI